MATSNSDDLVITSDGPLTGEQLAELKMLKIELRKFREVIEAPFKHQIAVLLKELKTARLMAASAESMMRQLTSENVHLRKLAASVGADVTYPKT